METLKEPLLRIPNGFETFTNPALPNFRNGNGRRRHFSPTHTSIFARSQCSSEVVSPAILQVKLTLLDGRVFLLIVVYRCQ